MTLNLPNVLIIIAVVALAINYVFFPGVLVGEMRKRWPGIFETHNPEPEELPMSWMIGCIIGIACVIAAGFNWGVLAAVAAIYLGFFIGVVVMHVPPYIRHQYRRLCGRAQKPLEC
jgi:uncharacterized membrane protein SpoIIM required for sporulation